jgi:hypothetical protein
MSKNIDFDITRSQVQTKYDGSHIAIYHDGDEWNCATRKMAFAEGQTPKGNTYKELVERCLGFKIEQLEDILFKSKNDTIICEVVSPETRVVIPYPDDKLYVLAIRNKFTGKYYDREDIDNLAYTLKLNYGCKIDSVDCFRMDTINEVINTAKELEPMDYDGEGFVCYDPITQNRIKIKNPSYVQLHHLRENGAISNKRIALLIFEQDHEEYLSYFNCDRPYFEPYINAYNRMIEDIHVKWNLYKNIESQKDFALTVKDTPIASIMFQLRKGLTLDEIFSNMHDKKKVELLEKYKGDY